MGLYKKLWFKGIMVVSLMILILGGICIFKGYAQENKTQKKVTLPKVNGPVAQEKSKDVGGNVLKKDDFVSLTHQSLVKYCPDIFKDTGTCPLDVCVMGCVGGIQYEQCPKSCQPRPCVEIDVAHCPTEDCDIVMGCNDEEVCYYKWRYEPPECGDLAYTGNADCCPGLTKRCGVAYFDNTCDMQGEHSVYSVPICVPCGNGICNQFEDVCNCPEDCS